MYAATMPSFILSVRFAFLKRRAKAGYGLGKRLLDAGRVAMQILPDLFLHQALRPGFF
jgi:hypothetical protein